MLAIFTLKMRASMYTSLFFLLLHLQCRGFLKTYLKIIVIFFLEYEFQHACVTDFTCEFDLKLYYFKIVGAFHRW